jgi:glycosyltransferase involved in cell wall biosynthesis
MTFVDAEGLPPAESFVLGCPVISSNISCLESQLGKNVILVNPLNPSELADAMLSVQTNNKIRNNFIIKGKNEAKNLRKEVFAKKMLEVFDEFALYKKRWGD